MERQQGAVGFYPTADWCVAFYWKSRRSETAFPGWFYTFYGFSIGMTFIGVVRTEQHA